MHNLVRYFIGGDIKKAIDRSRLVRRYVQVRSRRGLHTGIRWFDPNKNKPKETKNVSAGRTKTYDDVLNDVSSSIKNAKANKMDIDTTYNQVLSKVEKYHNDGVINSEQMDQFTNGSMFQDMYAQG